MGNRHFFRIQNKEEREKEANRQYVEALKYKKRIAGEREKLVDIYRKYPLLQEFLQKRMRWLVVLRYIGLLALTVYIPGICVAFKYENDIGIYDFFFLLIWGMVYIVCIVNQDDVRVPIWLFLSMAAVLAFNLFSFLWPEGGISSLDGFAAGIEIFLLKAGVSLPEAMEDNAVTIFLEYDIWCILRSVSAMVFYLAVLAYMVMMALPKNRDMCRWINEINQTWIETQGDMGEGQQGEESECQNEILDNVKTENAAQELPEKWKGRERKRVKREEQQKKRERETKKFMEIYEEYPELGRFMQKRAVTIRQILILWCGAHVFWVANTIGLLPIQTLFFSLIFYFDVAATMYACLTENPDREYRFLCVTVGVLAIHMLPFMYEFIGDTPIFVTFSFLFWVIRELLGIAFGWDFSGSEDWFLDICSKYNDNVIVSAMVAGLLYLSALLLAVQMVLPKNMKLMRQLKELSDTWQKDGEKETVVWIPAKNNGDKK